jgi:uncharacterized membrane protein YjfL (UPF0719 family)
MHSDWLDATLFNLGLNLLHALVALLVGVVGLKLIDTWVLRRLDIEEELKKGNLAVAVFASALLLFVGLMLAFGLRG